MRPHWIALVFPGIVAVLVIAGWGVGISSGPVRDRTRRPVLGASGVAVFLLIWYPVRKFIAWATSWFVTSDRVIHREG